MTAVRFTLPAGYTLGTWHRGFIFSAPRTPGPSVNITFGYDIVFADKAERTPFSTLGAAVRAIIERAGLVGESRDVLLAEIARLPETMR